MRTIFSLKRLRIILPVAVFLVRVFSSFAFLISDVSQDARGSKKVAARLADVIDDSVNNGLGFQPIDIINDHLPELQWLRSIIRKMPTSSADTSLSLPVSLLFPLSSALSALAPLAVVVSSPLFLGSPPAVLFAATRHRLRVIPA